MTDVDSGTAYGLRPGSYDRELVEVGPGTPGGELLRRYWHPVALCEEATDLPKRIRVLGEDRILFRDGRGHPGLLYSRCCHRGASLYYGKVEKSGIRCCYHGWLFDTQGHCLEQPCEPDGGRKRHQVRQPWHPVVERYGMIFAYLGPPERKPVLPRYDVLEDVPEPLRVRATSHTLQTGGPEIMPCNWVQTYENVVDPLHAPVVHGMISGPQLGQQLAAIPESVFFEETERGMTSNIVMKGPDGTLQQAVVELVFPNVSLVPVGGIRPDGRAANVTWTLPLDDTHTKLFSAAAIPPEMAGFDSTRMPVFGGKNWFELDEEGHQRHPGDYEAQAGQGAITLHSEEHLVSSDRGVVLFRKLYRP